MCVDDERGTSFDVARMEVFITVACDSATSNRPALDEEAFFSSDVCSSFTFDGLVSAIDTPEASCRRRSGMDDDDIDARGSFGISFGALLKPASCDNTDARGIMVLWVADIARSSTSSERRVSRGDANAISFSCAMDVAVLDARFVRACKEGEFA